MSSYILPKRAVRILNAEYVKVEVPDIPAEPSAGILNPCADIEFYLIEVDFDALPDKAERAYYKDLPTSFHLSYEAVDLLRAAGRRVLIHSPEFQRLLRDLK